MSRRERDVLAQLDLAEVESVDERVGLVLDTLTRKLLEIRAENVARWEVHRRPDDDARLERVHESTLEQLRAMGYVE